MQPQGRNGAAAKIADRAAFISMKLELMQIADLAGKPMDLQKFGELVDRGRRSFETIGLSRRAREIDPGLDTYLASPKERTAGGNGDATSKQPHAELEAGTAPPTEPEDQCEGAA